jgi:hypothetical protein
MENEIKININTNSNYLSDNSAHSKQFYNSIEDNLNIHIYDDLVDSDTEILIADDYLDKIQLYDNFKENKKNNLLYILGLPIIVIIIPLFTIYRYIF